MKKCKDFEIVKVRYYADKKLLDKWHKTGIFPTQHRDRAEMYTKFIWDFIVFITKKEQSYWYNEYKFDARECALEELEDDFSICIHKCEGYEEFAIPIENVDAIEWFYKNITLPYKKMKWMSLWHLKYERDLKFHRNFVKEMSNNI